MRSRSNFQERFRSSPRILQRLVQLLGGVSLGVGLLAMVASSWTTPLLTYLPLSAEGISHYFFWQWLSYVLILPGALSFTVIVNLFFSIYLLWVAGKAIIEKIGQRAFVPFIMAVTLGGGVAGWLGLKAMPTGSILSGAIPLAYGLLVAWMMHYPQQRISLLLVGSISLRIAVLALVGINLLHNLSSGLYAQAAATFGATVMAYLYGLLIWNLAGPFPFLRSFERLVANLGLSGRRLLGGRIKQTKKSKVHSIHDAPHWKESAEERDARQRRMRYRAWESSRGKKENS